MIQDRAGRINVQRCAVPLGQRFHANPLDTELSALSLDPVHPDRIMKSPRSSIPDLPLNVIVNGNDHWLF